jgi:hypothetical protein
VVPLGGPIGVLFILSPPQIHHLASVIVLINFDDKIGVQSLFRVFGLVIILHLYWKENPNTFSIFIVDQAFLGVCVVNNPLQEFYAGEHWSYARHHVQV